MSNKTELKKVYNLFVVATDKAETSKRGHNFELGYDAESLEIFNGMDQDDKIKKGSDGSYRIYCKKCHFAITIYDDDFEVLESISEICPNRDMNTIEQLELDTIAHNKAFSQISNILYQNFHEGVSQTDWQGILPYGLDMKSWDINPLEFECKGNIPVLQFMKDNKLCNKYRSLYYWIGVSNEAGNVEIPCKELRKGEGSTIDDEIEFICSFDDISEAQEIKIIAQYKDVLEQMSEWLSDLESERAKYIDQGYKECFEIEMVYDYCQDNEIYFSLEGDM